MKIRFLKSFGDYNAGDIVEFEDADAKSLIEAKIAEKAVESQAKHTFVKLKAAKFGKQAGEIVDMSDLALKAAVIAKGEAEDCDDPAGATLDSAIVKAVEAAMANIEAVVDARLKGVGQKVDAESKRWRPGSDVVEVTDPIDPMGGFKGLGHFCHAVVKGTGGSPEPSAVKSLANWSEMRRKAPSGMFEGEDPSGGVLVPPQMAQSIWERTKNQPDNLMSRADTYTVRGNAMKFPGMHETSRATGSRYGGIQVYWDGEADQFTSSRPKFDDASLKVHKLTGLAYMTDELMDDAEGLALESFLSRVFAEEFTFRINDAMVRGTGAGMPVGIKNAACTLSIAKESGQAADTIVYQNILKMWSRMYAPSRSNAVWHINQDAETQLYQMSLTVGTGGVPVYMPAGGVSGAPYSTLFARPIIPLEQCDTLGDEGDIMLCDWSQYRMIRKGGVKGDSSIHLRFDYGETAFRWSTRIDGAPAWKSALTPYKGSNTQSCFLTLAARA